MRSCYYTFTLLSVFYLLQTTDLKAQETQPIDVNPYPLTVGYSDANSVQDVLNFRLPKWSYSTLIFNYNSEFGRSNRDFVDKHIEDTHFPFERQSSRDGHILQNDFDIDYTKAMYSDDEILNYSLKMAVSNTNKNELNNYNNVFLEQDYNYNEYSKEDVFGLSTSIDFDIRNDRYFKPKLFYTAGLVTNLSYGHSKSEVNDRDPYHNFHLDTSEDDERIWLIDTTSETIKKGNRFIARTRPSLGFGFGRIRNVTPLFRALRMSHRLENLGYATLDRSQVQDLASKIVLSNGFDAVFNRPTKAHLNNLYSSDYLANKDLSPYDILYLNEEFTSSMVNRYEGFRISYNVSYDQLYDRSLNRRNEDSSTDIIMFENMDDLLSGDAASWNTNDIPSKERISSTRETYTLAHKINFQFYKNLNLKWMLGLNSSYNISHVRDINTTNDHKGRISSLSRGWSIDGFIMYDLTDRFSAKIESSYSHWGSNQTEMPVYCKISSNIFIENFLVVQPYTGWTEYKDRSYFHLGVSARVFLGRSLNF